MDKKYWEAINLNFPSQYREFEVWLGGLYATTAWKRLFPGVMFYDLPEMMQATVVFDFFKDREWEIFPADISDRQEVVQAITDSFGKKFLETLYE